MIHATARDQMITINDLKTLETADPARAGRQWKSVPHYEACLAVKKAVEDRGWKFGQPRIILNTGYKEMAASFYVRMPGMVAPAGQEFSIGIINSNTRHKRLRIVAGTTVLVCTNGMVVGDVKIARKHTLGLSLQDEVNTAIEEYRKIIITVPETIARLQDYAVSDTEADHILMAAGRERMIAFSRLGDIFNEFKHPRHAEHSTGTAWSLLNAFTQVVQRQPAVEQMDAIRDFRLSLEQHITTAA